MRTRLPTALLALALLLTGDAPARQAPLPAATPPVEIPDEDFQTLWDSVDPALEARLRAAIQSRPGWRSLAARRKLAVGLVDLSDPARPRFARVNGGTMMYAASLPKIAILLAAYASFEDGTLVETDEIHADLTAMIRTSSNSAATAMIDRLGFERIAEVLTDPRFQFYDPENGGGLWVGKRFAKEGRRVGDPIANISHAATVTQVSRFYYLLATGRVLGPERSRQMLEDLADPGLHHKFVGVLEKRAPLARLFRKSGTWKIWHSDSCLVWGPGWRRYILVAMVESPQGETILRELVPVAERLIEPRAADGAPRRALR